MKSKVAFVLPLGFLVLFCFWFFLFIFDADTKPSQWVAFGFGVVSCLVPPLLPMVSGRTYVGRASAWTVFYAFMFVELLASVVVIIIGSEAWKVPLFIQVLIAIAFLVVFVATAQINAATDSSQSKVQVARALQQDWTTQIKPLVVDRSLSPAVRRCAESAYDALRSLSVKTTPQAVEIDEMIRSEINALLLACERSDEEGAKKAALNIQSLARERNKAVLGNVRL